MEHRHFRLSVAAGLILAVLASSHGAANPVRVPGTRTSLEPPKGFSLSTRFPGFARAEAQASIMVNEIPAPAAEMMKGMTKEALATKGMMLISSKPERISGREALLLHVAQNAAGKEFLKWMLVTGDQNTSLMIVGTFPKSAESEVGAAIRGSVLTASWSPGSPRSHFEGLSFRITPTPKLKLAGRMSNMLMLTESGRTGPIGPTEALYIVGTSISDSRIGDLRSFSEARAKRTAQLRDIRNFVGRAFNVAGLAAYELLADAKDLKTGTAMRLYQVIAPEGGGYVIAQGLVGAARANELLPAFRQVTASYRKTTAGESNRPARR